MRWSCRSRPEGPPILAFLAVLLLLLKRKPAPSVLKDEEVTDEDLYRRFSEGEEKAFGVLLDRHGSKVMGYLTRFFGDADLAADLTQDVFLRVVSASGEFRGESSFKTFLYRVVRNLCIDVMRSRRARPDSNAASLDHGKDGDEDDRPLSEFVPGTAPGGELRVLSGELSGTLEAALGRLPAEQREVFLMREVEGLKFCEIAQVLGVNENTVKSRMHYAVTSLRVALAGFRD